jgi:hypothetical protein
VLTIYLIAFYGILLFVNYVNVKLYLFFFIFVDSIVFELIIYMLKPSNTTQEDISTSRQHVSTACSHLQAYK